MSKFRGSRKAFGAGAVTVLVIAALLSITMSTLGAKSPAAARWNHKAGAHALMPGALAEAAVESKLTASQIWQTISLVETYGDKFAAVDVGPGGDSVGDYVVFRDKVRNPSNNKVVGTIDVTCMQAFADMCRGVVRLNGRGQITFDGMTNINHDPDRYSIVGGNGEFADVGGVMRIDFPADDHADLTLTLTH